jgi:hypothetical protein
VIQHLPEQGQSFLRVGLAPDLTTPRMSQDLLLNAFHPQGGKIIGSTRKGRYRFHRTKPANKYQAGDYSDSAHVCRIEQTLDGYCWWVSTGKVFAALRYQPYLNHDVCVIQNERIAVVVLLNKNGSPRPRDPFSFMAGTCLGPKFEANLFIVLFFGTET